MEFIKLIPKTSRAKNRVREHGEVFEVRARKRVQCFGDRPSIFLEAEDGWCGWFCIEDEQWESTDESHKQN